MAELLPWAELEFRIALLPPVSRGIFRGPWLHAARLIDLWKVDEVDDVPLAQAFRLLDETTVAGVILRTLVAEEHSGDERHWHFPSLNDLLPELRGLSWQAMLNGTLPVEAIKGVRGKRYRAVPPVELPRLRPDWELSRLIVGTRDEFIDVRVRRIAAEPIKKAWRKKPANRDVEAAMVEIAKIYPPGARPGEAEIWAKLKGCLGDVTREQARNTLAKRAPHLQGQRGYRSKGKTPS